MIAPVLALMPLGSVLYSLTEAHLPGKIVIGVLGIFSIFAWTIMFTKFGEVNRIRRQNQDFLAALRAEKNVLNLYVQRVKIEGCALSEIYTESCKELASYARNETGGLVLSAPSTLTPGSLSVKQMEHVKGVLETTVAVQALKLEQGLVMLATAVSGGPFLGLLGTVWGVMDAFGEIAIQGNASLTTMAPGVSGALITTVTGLLVAIPSMFGYNWLVHTIRAMTVEMDNFARELASDFEREYLRD
jgi:biopolymer transport protein TolQ